MGELTVVAIAQVNDANIATAAADQRRREHSAANRRNAHVGDDFPVGMEAQLIFGKPGGGVAAGDDGGATRSSSNRWLRQSAYLSEKEATACVRGLARGPQCDRNVERDRCGCDQIARVSVTVWSIFSTESELLIASDGCPRASGVGWRAAQPLRCRRTCSVFLYRSTNTETWS